MAIHLTPTLLFRLAPMGAIAPAEIPGDDPGTLSDVTKTGAGTGALLVAGFPFDALSIVVRVEVGGDLGVAEIRVSKDAGVTFGSAVITQAAPREFQRIPFVANPEWRYEVPLTGVQLRLFNGSGTPNSFVATNTYAFTTTGSPRLLMHCAAVGKLWDEYARNQYADPENHLPNENQLFHMGAIARWRALGGRGLDEATARQHERLHDVALKYFAMHSAGDLRAAPGEQTETPYFPDVMSPRRPPLARWRH